MKNYITRILEDKVSEYLQIFPVLGITGPRQSGKSTMLKNKFGDVFRYITFDDFRYINLFNDDPERFMNMNNNKIIFDEVQKVPDLFSYIKRIVDENRSDYGRFILTGSAQFSMMASISESLAGRIGTLSLLPFEFNEAKSAKTVPSEFLGCYPEVVINNYQYSEVWYNAYLETYLEKDVRSISNIGNLSDFRRLVRMLAAHCSQIMNFSKLANSLGVAVNTIKKWISVLEASYIIYLLPPYYQNFNKRIIKSGKIYFYDTGLISAITGIQNERMYEDGLMAGPVFENYVISEIKKFINHRGKNAAIYFYRTSDHVEVDLIIESGNKKYVVEIKNSKTFKPKMVKPMEMILEHFDKGFLVYKGEEIRYSDSVEVLPYQKFLSSVLQSLI